MNNVVIHGVYCVAFLLSLSAVAIAAPPATNETEVLPIYPNTHARKDVQKLTDEKAVSEFVKQGNTISIYSSDSPEVIDRWYSTMLLNCVRKTIEGAHVYRYVCVKRTVNISPSQGQTSINLGPNVDTNG